MSHANVLNPSLNPSINLPGVDDLPSIAYNIGDGVLLSLLHYKGFLWEW